MSDRTDRELEKKWIVRRPATSFAKLSSQFGKYMLEYRILDADHLLYCDSIDNYWDAAERAKADIVRLRHSWGHMQTGSPRTLKEFTIKRKDKGDNFDRLELNNQVDSIETFRRTLTETLGTPKLTLRKDEIIAFMPLGIVASLARVWNDDRTKDFIVFEIEGPSKDTIEGVEEMLRYRKLMMDYELTQKSLLELFCDM